MRDTVDELGLSGLVAKSGEAAMEDVVRQIEEHQHSGDVSEETIKATFDPLMSMNNHYWSMGIQCGGIYMMGVDASGNEYCPLCEADMHMSGFSSEADIKRIGNDMLTWCREQKLVPEKQ